MNGVQFLSLGSWDSMQTWNLLFTDGNSPLEKESCEYLGEHSRKREEYSRKRDQQKNSGEMQLAGAENREVAEEIRSRRQVPRQLPWARWDSSEQGWDMLCLKRLLLGPDEDGGSWWAWGRDKQEWGVDATRTYCRTHGTLYSMLLCGSPDGRGVGRRLDSCICVSESLCRPPETITTQLIGYPPIQH